MNGTLNPLSRSGLFLRKAISDMFAIMKSKRNITPAETAISSMGRASAMMRMMIPLMITALLGVLLLL